MVQYRDRERYINGRFWEDYWDERYPYDPPVPPRVDDGDDDPIDDSLTPPPSTWLGNRAIPDRQSHMGRSAWMRWLDANRFKSRINAPVIHKDMRKKLLAQYPGGNPNVRSQTVNPINDPGFQGDSGNSGGVIKTPPGDRIAPPPSAPPDGGAIDTGGPIDNGGVPIPTTTPPGATPPTTQPPATQPPPTTTPPRDSGPLFNRDRLREELFGRNRYR